MDQRTFNVVASVIFALVALLHLLRIYMGWPIVMAPDIVRALLEGRQPIELTPTRLLRLSKELDFICG